MALTVLNREARIRELERELETNRGELLSANSGFRVYRELSDARAMELSAIRAALAEAGWTGDDLAEGVRFLGRVKVAAEKRVLLHGDAVNNGHEALVEALKESL